MRSDAARSYLQMYWLLFPLWSHPLYQTGPGCSLPIADIISALSQDPDRQWLEHDLLYHNQVPHIPEDNKARQCKKFQHTHEAPLPQKNCHRCEWSAAGGSCLLSLVQRSKLWCSSSSCAFWHPAWGRESYRYRAWGDGWALAGGLQDP